MTSTSDTDYYRIMSVNTQNVVGVFLFLFIAASLIAIQIQAQEVTNNPSEIAPLQIAQQNPTTINTSQQQFLNQLNQIENIAKRNTVEQIYTDLHAINEDKTTHWINTLDTLTNILTRVQTKIDTLATEEVDTSTILQLITTAESDIASATLSIGEQALNTYTIRLDNEQALKQSAQLTVTQAKSDLEATLQTVLTARDSTREAARELGMLTTGENTPSENTLPEQIINPVQ